MHSWIPNMTNTMAKTAYPGRALDCDPFLFPFGFCETKYCDPTNDAANHNHSQQVASSVDDPDCSINSRVAKTSATAVAYRWTKWKESN